MENLLRNRRPINGLTKFGLFVSSVLLLSNYYYLYFLDFNEGSVEGGAFFSLFRLVALFLFYFLVVKF